MPKNTKSSLQSIRRKKIVEAAPVETPGFIQKNKKLLTILVVVLLLGLLGNKFLVVAWVDKKPITKFEFFNSLDKKYGKDMREELIVEKLINSEAKIKKVAVTDAQIKEEIKKIEDQQGGPEKFEQALQAYGLTRESLYKQEKVMLLIQKIFGSNVVISDEEVGKFLEANKENAASPGAEVDDKARETARDQLKQTQVNETFNKWLSEALKSSRVTRL